MSCYAHTEIIFIVKYKTKHIIRERGEHELEKLRFFILFERVMLDKSRSRNSFSYDGQMFCT